jgi:arylsulfatase A-like enzyme
MPKRIMNAFGWVNILIIIIIIASLSGTIIKHISMLFGWHTGIASPYPTLLETLDLIRLSTGFYVFFFSWLTAVFILPSEKHKWNRTWRAVVLVCALYLCAWQLLAFSYINGSGAPIFFQLVLDFFRIFGSGMSNSTTFLLLPISIIAIYTSTTILQWFYLKRLGKPLRLKAFKALILTSIVGILMSSVPPYQDRIPRDIASGGTISAVRTTFQTRPDIYQHDPHAELPALSVPKNQKLNGKNVVFILLESTRADTISYYNPRTPPVTPYIDELVTESLVVDHAFSVIAYTSKALTAILCGIEPFIGAEVFANMFPSPIPCLPTILNEQGYNTVFFQSPTGLFESRKNLLKRIGFQNSYAHEDYLIRSEEEAGENNKSNQNNSPFEMVNLLGFEDRVMLEPSREWLSKNKKSPFLAVYLTFSTHFPYILPKHVKPYPYENNRQFNNYLNAVNYLDSFVEELISDYKNAGLYDNTIFVILGDHGEGFGEHTSKSHGYSAFNEVIQVPLIFHSPGFIKPDSHKTTVSQIDIAPTILDMLGFTNVEGYGGTSIYRDERKPKFVSCVVRQVCVARIDDEYKYIYYFQDKTEDLFAYRKDTGELIDLATERPELTKKFRTETFNWYSNQVSRYNNYYEAILPDFMDYADQTYNREKMEDFLIEQAKKKFK